MRKIGENIRFYRNLRGLTQTALARKVQVAPAYISQIEANQRVPSLKVTRRIGGVLGIEMSVLVREADPRVQEGRLSDSEKLDLLRTLIMSIEGESRTTDDSGEPQSLETADYVATELHNDPSFSLVLREFSGSGSFGREIDEIDVECHVVLGGRVRVVGSEDDRELTTGDCRSLSGDGDDRLQGVRGARVISIYSPSVTLSSIVAQALAEETAPQTV